MLYLRVIAALAWLVMTGLMSINWWFEEPVTPVGQAILAYSVLHVLGSSVLKAADSVDLAFRLWSSRIEGRC